MNERLQIWWDGIRKYVAEMSVQKRIAAGAIAAAVVLSIALAMMNTGGGPEYETLYSDLQPEEARTVASKLDELNIPFLASQDFRTLSVPKDEIPRVRMELAKAGLPEQDIVGFEKFDNTTFGMSSYVQRVQYQRALQGELTRSIQRIEEVRRARVHLSIPPKKTFLEDQESPKASVVLEMKPGKALTKTEIKGVAHLVASAVEGLQVNQVTIVDNNGKFLHRPDDEENLGVSNALLEAQRTLGKNYEQRVEEILTPVVGMGKVIAKVTVEIDPARVNTTEESFDPDRAAVTSMVRNDETSSGKRPNPMGMPGSRSNLPGQEVEEPGMPMASTSSEKNRQNARYAVPRKVQRTDKPSGNIKRLTVAVLVDGHYQVPDGATEEQFVPRSEEELNRIQDLVANAVGYDPERRDSINVSSMPFKKMELAPEEPPPAFSWKDFSKQLLKNGLIATVVILFFFLILRPFLRWITLTEVEQEIALMPGTVAELELAQQDKGVLALTKAVSVVDDPEPLEKKEAEELKKLISSRIEEFPNKGIRVVQEWLDEEDLPVQKRAKEVSPK